MNNLFHVLNRGVEKRKIFSNDGEYIRFIHGLNDFNDSKKVKLPYTDRKKAKHLDIGRPGVNSGVLDDREEIVDILCWTLLPNHFHILNNEKEISGVGEFCRKSVGGYTKFFNEKYDRSGVLFQGKTKIKLIDSEAYFMYIPFYIHLNILDVVEPGWREKGIKDVKKAIEKCFKYRWSNLRDIVGEGNGEFAHITNKELFFEIFDTNEKQYKKDFIEWIKSKEYENIDFDFHDFE